MSTDWGDIRTSEEGLFPHGPLPRLMPEAVAPGRFTVPSRMTYHGRPRDVLAYIAFAEALEPVWEAVVDPRPQRARWILFDIAFQRLENFKLTTTRYVRFWP